MINFFKYLLLFGVPFGILMGLTYTVQGNDSAFGRAALAGTFFGALMAAWLVWYLRRHRLRLASRGITATDMRPRQTREVHLPAPPAIAMEACAQVIRTIPKARIVATDAAAGTIAARVGMTMRSFGEHLSLTVSSAGEGSTVRIQSAPVVRTTVFDYGKGVENVESIRQALLGQGIGT